MDLKLASKPDSSPNTTFHRPLPPTRMIQITEIRANLPRARSWTFSVDFSEIPLPLETDKESFLDVLRAEDTVQ